MKVMGLVRLSKRLVLNAIFCFLAPCGVGESRRRQGVTEGRRKRRNEMRRLVGKEDPAIMLSTVMGVRMGNGFTDFIAGRRNE